MKEYTMQVDEGTIVDIEAQLTKQDEKFSYQDPSITISLNIELDSCVPAKIILKEKSLVATYTGTMYSESRPIELMREC